MKCKNKEVLVDGIVHFGMTGERYMQTLRCICTNDEKGKTLSVDNGVIQFSVRFEELEKYFKGDYKK
jgi:hypothetical protein